MTMSREEFYELAKEYKAAEDFFKAHVLEAKTDEENGVLALRAIVTRLLLEPCTTSEEMVRKVTFILSEPGLVEWLGNEEELVRMLLASFMCLKAA